MGGEGIATSRLEPPMDVEVDEEVDLETISSSTDSEREEGVANRALYSGKRAVKPSPSRSRRKTTASKSTNETRKEAKDKLLAMMRDISRRGKYVGAGEEVLFFFGS